MLTTWMNEDEARRMARALRDFGFDAEPFFRATGCGYAVYELTTGTVLRSWTAFVRFVETH